MFKKDASFVFKANNLCVGIANADSKIESMIMYYFEKHMLSDVRTPFRLEPICNRLYKFGSPKAKIIIRFFHRICRNNIVNAKILYCVIMPSPIVNSYFSYLPYVKNRDLETVCLRKDNQEVTAINFFCRNSPRLANLYKKSASGYCALFCIYINCKE